MIVLMIAVFAALIMLEVPGLVKKKLWRELTAYSALMLIAIVISVLYLKQVEVPNPVKNTQYYVQNMFEFLFNFTYD